MTIDAADTGRAVLLAAVVVAAVAPPQQVAPRLARWMPRILDVVLSGSALVLLSPVLAVVSLAVRRQPGLAASPGRVGRLVRRFSLDEIPQLYDVLVGDLTLVGPHRQASADARAGGVHDE